MSPEPVQVAIPKPRDASELARKIAAGAAIDREAAAAAARKLPSGECYALGCNSNYGHVGILFADGVNPLMEARIHGGMWFSSYHDIGDPWMYERSELTCMECEASLGLKTVLRVEHVTAPREMGFCFRVPAEWSRFVHKVNAAKYLPKQPDPVAEPKDEPKKKGEVKP